MPAPRSNRRLTEIQQVSTAVISAPPPRIAQAKLVAIYKRATQMDADVEHVLDDLLRNERGASSEFWSKFTAGLKLVQESFLLLSSLVDKMEAGSVPSSRLGPLPGDGPRPNPVSDIAFISATVLRHKYDRMAKLDQDSPTRLLADNFASGMRHILKSVGAVEAALAQSSAFTTRLDATALLHNSLAVRRAFSEFRLLLKTGPTIGKDALEFQQKAIQLLRNPAYKLQIRLTDRLELSDLERRLTMGLKDVPEPGLVTQLISDVATFSQVLVGVSFRQELIEHDLLALPLLVQEVEGLKKRDRPVLRGHLEKVRGIDDKLEELLCAGAPLDISTILLELRRIKRERSRAGGMPVIELPF